MFSYIMPAFELVRQQEYMAGAEVMKHVATTILTSMLISLRCSITAIHG